MATTYENLLRSALSNATRGMKPDQVAIIVDGLSVADTLFPIVAQAVSEAAAADEFRRSLLLRTKSVTLAAGLATLTDDVLLQFVTSDGTFFDPASLTKKYAGRPYWQFVRRSDPRLGEFTANGTTLMVREPNQQFATPLTASGIRTLVTPCQIVKPATAATNVDAPDILISDLDEALSESLRGQFAAGAIT